MDEITVTKEHMDALKALSEVNLKVSEARNLLVKLQEQETEYLVSREKKAVDAVQNVLAQSHELVEETNKNYDYLQNLSKSVSEGVRFLAEASEAFKSLAELKDEHYTLWERDIKNLESTVTSLRNGLKVGLEAIESDKRQVEAGNAKLKEDQRKLNDDRKEVERAIKRLKEGRI